jgi:hypothetical protein
MPLAKAERRVGNRRRTRPSVRRRERCGLGRPTDVSNVCSGRPNGSIAFPQTAAIGAILSPGRVPAKVGSPPDSAVRSGRPERRVCAALPPFGCPWVNESNRPQADSLGGFYIMARPTARSAAVVVEAYRLRSHWMARTRKSGRPCPGAPRPCGEDGLDRTLQSRRQ